jgi:hypothetical protein
LYHAVIPCNPASCLLYGKEGPGFQQGDQIGPDALQLGFETKEKGHLYHDRIIGSYQITGNK